MDVNADELAGSGKILWYPQYNFSSDLRVCPPRLTVQPSEVRMVHNCSSFVNPEPDYDAMYGFPTLLRPGA